MRDILIVLAMCLAAIIVGALLFFKGPELLEKPTDTAEEQTPVLEEQPTATPQSVSFRVLENGGYATNVTERKNFAVYDAEEFARLWTMAHGTGEGDVPTIDFSREYVIGVFAGEKPSGGYGIRVTGVTDTGTVRTVAIEQTVPAAGCMQSQALTSPYQLVVVPASSADLRPAESTVETPCR